MSKSQKNAAGLRQRAEAIAQGLADESPALAEETSPEAVRRILHELRVHQIELEMQNEELRAAQLQLDTSRACYVDLYDRAPVGYCSVSEAGQIVQANLTLATLLGTARGALLRRMFSRFVAKDDQDRYYQFFTQLLATGVAKSGELRLCRNDGASIWVHLAASVAQDAGATVLRVVVSDISARKQSEALLHKSEAFNRAVLDSLGAQIAVLAHDGRVLAVNRAWRQFALENGAPSAPGMEPGMAPVSIGSNYLAVCLKAGALVAHEGIRAVLEGRLPDFNLEYPCPSPQEPRWFNMSVTPFGEGVVIAHTNISEHKKAEEALREQEAFFHLIAENLGDYIAVLDPQGRRLYNSPSYLNLFGDNQVLQGSDSFAEVHPDDRERVKQVFLETVQTGIARHITYRFVAADGRVREMESRGNVIVGDDGRVARVVVVAQDITERRQLENEVRQLAFHDALTQLPNRRLLDDRLNQAMAASARSACYGALMFLDLDNFKPLNDTHGHEVGDLLLVEAGKRLKSCVREGDTVARFGGDEFVVMVSELDTDHAASLVQAQVVAEKILSALSDVYQLTVECDDQTQFVVEHRCTVSVGVVLFINHAENPIDLLKWADRAMYRAKQVGGDSIWFYE